MSSAKNTYVERDLRDGLPRPRPDEDHGESHSEGLNDHSNAANDRRYPDNLLDAFRQEMPLRVVGGTSEWL